MATLHVPTHTAPLRGLSQATFPLLLCVEIDMLFDQRNRIFFLVGHAPNPVTPLRPRCGIRQPFKCERDCLLFFCVNKHPPAFPFVLRAGGSPSRVFQWMGVCTVHVWKCGLFGLLVLVTSTRTTNCTKLISPCVHRPTLPTCSEAYPR